MQGEYYYLMNKLQDELNNTLSKIKGNMAVAPINLVNEYMYERMEDASKDHIFFFRVESITKLLEYDFAVKYTLHEHASIRMVNIAMIGVLMSLNERNTITQTKINDGYLFSTSPLETVINLYEYKDEFPIVEKIEVDINGVQEIIENKNIIKQCY